MTSKGDVMGTVHADMATSLDGFIAGPNGGPRTP
jgi:hypothetical protein